MGIHITIWDYGVFFLVLLISAIIGLYSRFTGGKQRTLQVQGEICYSFKALQGNGFCVYNKNDREEINNFTACISLMKILSESFTTFANHSILNLFNFYLY